LSEKRSVRFSSAAASINSTGEKNQPRYGDGDTGGVGGFWGEGSQVPKQGTVEGGVERRESIGGDPLTGVGKGLMFMLPVWLKGGRTTIVVSPFVALANGTERGCKEAGIECIQWRDGRQERAKLVIMSVESAVSKDFMNYAAGLYLSEQLDRIVFDKCHLVMTADDGGRIPRCDGEELNARVCEMVAEAMNDGRE